MELDNKQTETIEFEFSGQSFEYFGIWITNLLLTIVTLGIYSAWAKVRNTQYIYSHTRLDNSSFEYTAKPLDILKGRIIAVGLFLIYMTIVSFFPLAELALLPIVVLAIPYLIVSSLRYNYVNSVYRNIRFQFKGTVGRAFCEFLLWPLLIIPTLGLIMPYIRWRQTKFLVDSTQYGDGKFNMNARVGGYYSIFLKTIGLFILTLIMAGILTAGIMYVLLGTGLDLGEQGSGEAIGIAVGALLFYPIAGLLFLYSMARMRNLVYNNTFLEEHTFESSISARTLMFLWVTNVLAIGFSFGLAIPWTRIRMARYYASKTKLIAKGDLNSFIAQQESTQSAFGQEMGDVMDIDINVGI